ncbi:hypothetical protein JCM10213_003895 [Rhodosporidiobolus nylandii]
MTPTVTGECLVCGKDTQTRCARCGDFFCSQECQKLIWVVHKRWCNPTRTLTVPPLTEGEFAILLRFQHGPGEFFNSLLGVEAPLADSQRFASLAYIRNLLMAAAPKAIEALPLSTISWIWAAASTILVSEGIFNPQRPYSVPPSIFEALSPFFARCAIAHFLHFKRLGRHDLSISLEMGFRAYDRASSALETISMSARLREDLSKSLTALKVILAKDKRYPPS